MELRTLQDAPIKKGTRVILRADFDIVIEKGKVQEDFRIQETLPTIEYLLARGSRILILTKRGHFKIRRSPALSTRILLPHLEKLIGEKVYFLSGLGQLKSFSSSPNKGRVFLFENLRFWPEEEANDPAFAKRFARSADIYVSDNFGTAHRMHASVVGIPKLLPSYAGLLLEREVHALEKIIKNPRKPLIAVLGGAKLETKLPLIKKFLVLGDAVFVGGALANTLLFAKGMEVGKSVVEKDYAARTRPLLSSRKLYLPVDTRVAPDIHSPKARTSDIVAIHSREAIFDIGPRTVALFSAIAKGAKTIVWNGPLGIAEIPRYSLGTRSIARSIIKSRAFKVVGGGDTIAVLRKYGLLHGFNHVSTGGGAMLEFLAGKKLPGIEVLKK